MMIPPDSWDEFSGMNPAAVKQNRLKPVAASAGNLIYQVWRSSGGFESARPAAVVMNPRDRRWWDESPAGRIRGGTNPHG
jgi:hypothetical protein